MNDKKASIKRLRISRFKLDSLLEITRSINANLPTEALLSKYEVILRNDLGIGKVLIYMYSAGWHCILNGGFPRKFEKEIDVESQLLRFTEITFREMDTGIKGVDIIIPIYNNSAPLAFVLISDIEEEGKGMSPLITHLNFIQTFSNVILVAIENNRLNKESLLQEALKKEIELAARMQQKLIPDNQTMPVGPNLNVTGFYFPHYEVGGDYYDFIRLSDNKSVFCIADVSGKGISAAILMSNFQASLRALLTSDIDLIFLVRKLNSLINSNAAGEKFITFFIARFDERTCMLEYLNAGHNPPVIYNTITHEVSHLHSTTVGIGMLDEMPSVRKENIFISGYSKMVCYTDGLSDLKGDDGKEILTKEIINYISNDLPVKQNINGMLEKLGIPGRNPQLFDDISIIAVDLRKP